MKSECETPTPDTRTYKWASLHLDSKVQSKDWDHDEVFFSVLRYFCSET